jgi:hypothetical protein
VATRALTKAGVRYCLIGSLATWIQGGEEPDHDLDLAIDPTQLLEAAAALHAAGLQIEIPTKQAEDWLFKAWISLPDGQAVCLDVIHTPLGVSFADLLAGARLVLFAGESIPVASLTDTLSIRLLAIHEYTPTRLDFRSLLALARALGKTADWEQIQQRTASSPYARAFLVLVKGLEIDTAPPNSIPISTPAWYQQRERVVALAPVRAALLERYGVKS